MEGKTKKWSHGGDRRGCVRREELSEKTVSLRKAFISVGRDGRAGNSASRKYGLR